MRAHDSVYIDTETVNTVDLSVFHEQHLSHSHQICTDVDKSNLFFIEP